MSGVGGVWGERSGVRIWGGNRVSKGGMGRFGGWGFKISCENYERDLVLWSGSPPR